MGEQAMFWRDYQYAHFVLQKHTEFNFHIASRNVVPYYVIYYVIKGFTSYRYLAKKISEQVYVCQWFLFGLYFYDFSIYILALLQQCEIFPVYHFKGRSPSNGKLSDFSFYIDS